MEKSSLQLTIKVITIRVGVFLVSTTLRSLTCIYSIQIDLKKWIVKTEVKKVIMTNYHDNKLFHKKLYSIGDLEKTALEEMMSY